MPTTTPSPKVITCKSLELFVAQLAKRKNVRLAKVDDQGLVQPVRRVNAFVMQPMVRVVATAYDKKKNEIVLWEHNIEVGSGSVGIKVAGGSGTHHSFNAFAIKKDTIGRLELEGYQVSDGEWTPASVQAILVSSGPVAV